MGSVTITLPIHPLRGRSFPLVQRYGHDQVLVESAPGVHLRLPASWTDLRPRLEPPTIDGHEVRLDARAMQDLAHLVRDRLARGSR